MLGDNERARVNYRNAHGDDPTYLPALLRWASLALSEKWWQDVVIAVPAVLVRTDAGLTQDEQVEYLEGLGHAQLALGEAELAAAAFTQALEIAPDNKACREALANAHGRLSGKGPETHGPSLNSSGRSCRARPRSTKSSKPWPASRKASASS
jgi:tetratricopeptide (TPR) repeat protein